MDSLVSYGIYVHQQLFYNAVLMPDVCSQCTVMGTNPNILVLGAGFAGIGAATKLESLGFKDVTIIEASGLAGGRIAKECLGEWGNNSVFLS